jgi:O-acetyl-ADP-ribose deacetylase (regulator of RNase III)
MIAYATGDLLQAQAEALVNTVNCVGVMGKGIALQFKRQYPENFHAYEKACKRGEVTIGRMFVTETGHLDGPRYLINFPTKDHWRRLSRLSDIDTGLIDLVRVLRDLDIRSVAVPPLGAGNGGLDWAQVEPRIIEALQQVPAVHATIYLPCAARARSS